MFAQLQQQRPVAAGARAQPVLPLRPAARRIGAAIVGSRVACRAAASDAPPMEAEVPLAQRLSSDDLPGPNAAFPYPLPMDPAQSSLSNMPLAVFYPAMLAFVGVAGLLGAGVGRALPVDPDSKDATSIGTAAVFGAGALAAAFQAKKKRDSAVVVDLYNTIAELPDANQLTGDMVAAIGSKYGINLRKEELAGLQQIYEQYLESLIPAGEFQLRGHEADSARSLKEALGLSDEEAAPAHLEVAQKLYKQGFETKDRQTQFENRKAFQRLIYVSQIVFGDQKAAFLLPWRKHFPITEAQIFVARRDNAKTIFKALFEAAGGDLKADRHYLRELRDKQLAVRMLDESAEEVIKEYARRHVENCLTRAQAAIRGGDANRQPDVLIAEMQHVLEYSRTMHKMADEEDLVPGLGHVTIQGGAFAGEFKARELRDLFRAYLEERMERQGGFTEALDHEAKELQTIFCLSSKDAQSLRDEVVAKLYKRLLREEVSSRRIDEAASPAAVLQTLCEKVRFGPESALELHKQLYRTKLTALVSKGKLSDEDQAELKRIRRILCIPQDVANKVAKDVCGKPLMDVFTTIFEQGVRPVSENELKAVEKVIKELGIDADVATEVLAQAAKDRFKQFVKEAQKSEDRRSGAGHLTRLVQFNTLVVSPVLDKIKGKDAAMKELAELLAKATEEAKKEGASEAEVIDVQKEVQKVKAREETIKEVQKAIQASRGDYGEDVTKAQKEITLKGEMEEKTMGEIYKNYLMFAMTGDVVELPVGGVSRKKNDAGSRQTAMNRVTALADLLGMTQMDMMKAQMDLAEQAYKGQVQEVMKSGPMTQEKAEYLESMRNQLGLNKEQGDKVLKEVRTEVYGSSSAILEDGGRWTLDKIKQLTAGGGSIEGQVEEITRRNIFRKELERSITDGSGDLDPTFVLEELPKMLVLPERKVQQTVKELVSSRKRMLLVQAVSTMRQRRPAETVLALQNLLSCNRVLPEKVAMPWNERAELKDVFQTFCSEEASGEKRRQLQTILGLTDDEALALGASSEVEVRKPVMAGDEDDIFL